MSYNANRDEIGQLMGRYASQILNGAKPADLPVMQLSNFVFAINLKTAKALGITIPVCTENLNPDILVMKSAKDRA